MNLVHSPLVTSFPLSEMLDLSAEQLHHGPCEPHDLSRGIPNPAQPRRKAGLACRTPIASSSLPYFWGKEVDPSLWSWQRWESPQPSGQTCPTCRRTTGHFYSSSPSLGGGRDLGTRVRKGWRKLVGSAGSSIRPELLPRGRRWKLNIPATRWGQ